MLRFAQFGAGRIGTVHASNFAATGATQLRYVVDVNPAAAAALAAKHGAKGRLIAGNRVATTVELVDRASVSADRPLYFFLERYAEAYRAELAAFVDAVVNPKPMPVTADDGRMAIVLAEAAVKSLKTERPVKVK